MPISDSLAHLSINTIRTLSIDAVQHANSGHPGLPMGAAPMAYVLWTQHLRHNPKNPHWANRDRFVLSAGHGSMLLYSLLHLTGYPLSLDEIKNFRAWGSKTPGHPEVHFTPGVEATTGPLGQGSANAVGMAMAEKALAARFNRPGFNVVDHFTYALVSDGDLMEGVSGEAASLAGHLGLGKLIYLYDANDVTLDGPANLSFSEDICARYASYGWHTQTVAKGDTDLAGLDKAISNAKSETGKPSLILVKTTIGFGSPKKAGTSDSHGSPLGPDEVAATKRAYGWDENAKFLIPNDVSAHLNATAAGEKLEAAWNELCKGYEKAHSDLAAQWKMALAGDLPPNWDSELPTFAAGKSVATRSAAGDALNAVAKKVPWLWGGDADLGGSTKTLIKDGGSFSKSEANGRNIHFGVREHAMGSICNGMDYHGGIRPFAATFFCFSDYMRPAVRLAALNGQPIIYVWTHDSIGLGEDGPTHQPVEHLAALRAMPNLYVVRPADANEAVEAWRFAMLRKTGPTALVLSRQNLPTFDRTKFGPAKGLHQGAYVLWQHDAAKNPTVLLLATGSEVCIAVAAAEILAKKGQNPRVVSMPCWEAFAEKTLAERNAVLPPDVKNRVGIEAGVSFGWNQWLGDSGKMISVEKFGASAPAEVLYEKYGLTAEAIVAAVG